MQSKGSSNGTGVLLQTSRLGLYYLDSPILLPSSGKQLGEAGYP
jgi:hypothetical protein